jgi:23S rRNA pseudouridine1911/1915/1917 synthase
MSSKYSLTVDMAGKRLDVYIADQCQISRAYAQKLIGSGDVLVNGQPVKASYKLTTGDKVDAIIPPPAPISLAAEDISLKVIYEDADLIVVDKPAGMIVHPVPGQYTGTLVNAILAHCPDLGGIDGSLRPGIVHRLDKNTSGIMMVAKNDSRRQKAYGSSLRGPGVTDRLSRN